MAGGPPLRDGDPGAPIGRAVRLPRRSALRERADPRRAPAQQGAQGLRGAHPPHGGTVLPLRAGLGLPRPAHRAPGHDRAPLLRRDQAPRCARRRRSPHGDPAPLRRVRPGVRRSPGQRHEAPADARGLRPPLPDARSRLREGRAGRLRAAPRAGARVPRAQVRPLVDREPDGPRRSRAGVRGPGGRRGLRGLRGRGPGSGRPRVRRGARRDAVLHDLDDDAVDAPGQPGDRRPRRLPLRARAPRRQRHRDRRRSRAARGLRSRSWRRRRGRRSSGSAIAIPCGGAAPTGRSSRRTT